MQLVCGFLAFFFICGCATAVKTSTPAVVTEASPEPVVRERFRLVADAYWRLDLPDGKPFDASGLLLDAQGLLTVSDEGPGLYRVNLGGENVAQLQAVEILTAAQLSAAMPEARGFDLEGLARDDAGRIYVSEESRRWVLRFDAATKKIQRLEIDWSPMRKYFNGGANAGFEGIAVAGNKLWVANERDQSRIFEVNLNSQQIVADFRPLPSSLAFFLHYSDLAWHGGKLFVLLRHQREILEIDLSTREVIAEYNYGSVEDAPEHEYVKEYPTGTMEGLAVDNQYFWLVTDNNGLRRRRDGKDRRPTLFRCPRAPGGVAR